MEDNYDRWRKHDAEQEEALAKLPKCGCCQEYIQDEYFYLINDENICVHCMNEYYRKDTEDYAR